LLSKTKAIVLSKIKVSDHKEILKCFSEEDGILSLLFFNKSTKKSSQRTNFQIFQEVEFVFQKIKEAQLPIVKEFTIVRARLSLLDNPINRFIAGTIGLFVGFVGVLGLFGSLIARTVGGFAGLATAMIEGFEAIGLMKVSMDQSTVSMGANTVAEEVNTKAKVKNNAATLESAAAEGVDAAASKANAASKDGLSAATLRAAKSTRIFKFALTGLGIGLAVGVIFAVIDQIYKSLKIIDKRAKVEASGNVSLGTVEQIAKTGVDYISIGKITHSAPSVDIGLDIK